jgi:hypothetical protein
MNSLKIIENLYKPYKITIKRGVTLVDCSEGRFVLKKENKDLFPLYSYLSKRGIDLYPNLIRNFNNQDNLLEYLSSINLPLEQYLDEMASSIALIHLKTAYNKSISIDEIKELKENIESNIDYLNKKYHDIIKNILLHSFMTPKEYFFVRNYYKIQEALDFCKEEINNWFILVKDNPNIRLSLIHNNLSIDHFIVSENKNAFISWDNYRFDIPMIDLVNLYKNECIDDYFNNFLNKYFSIFSYDDIEKKLFFILLTIPDYINLEDELPDLKIKINKVNNTEKLIRPYYTKNEKE